VILHGSDTMQFDQLKRREFITRLSGVAARGTGAAGAGGS
jgi:hypothetical protein